MDEIELLRLQDEALSYLRDNITKDEAYYILTTDKDIIEILIVDKKDGSKRININNIMNNIIENNDGVKRKVRVYDFGEKVADRYTIVCVSDRNKDSRGILFYPMFTCNENPSHPQGIGMYVGDYYPHKGGMYNLGRRVKDIMSLPKEVIRYIKWVTTT